MDFAGLRAVGRRIEEQWRGRHYLEEAFSEIATRALEEAELSTEVDFGQVTDFLLDPEAPSQDLRAVFGDVNLAVYTTPRFAVQALVWTAGTADVHDHPFSGAFRVLTGSSIHSRWQVAPTRRINRALLVVDAELEQVELLQAGDVRTILAGSALTHGVFHLEKPTVTIVARTYREDWAGPEYVLAPPHLAISPALLRNDAQLASVKRTLKAMHAMRHPGLADVVVRAVEHLDFARCADLLRSAYPILGPHLPRVREALAARDPEIAAHIDASLAEVERLDTINGLRHGVTDPEGRFFLAAILLCRTQAQVLQLVSERFPGADPAAKKDGWIDRLSPLVSFAWSRLS